MTTDFCLTGKWEAIEFGISLKFMLGLETTERRFKLGIFVFDVDFTLNWEMFKEVEFDDGGLFEEFELDLLWIWFEEFELDLLCDPSKFVFEFDLLRVFNKLKLGSELKFLESIITSNSGSW